MRKARVKQNTRRKKVTRNTRVTRAGSARKQIILPGDMCSEVPVPGRVFWPSVLSPITSTHWLGKNPTWKDNPKILAISKYKRYNFGIKIWGLWYGRIALRSFRRFRRNSQLFSKWLDDFLSTYNLFHFTLRAEVKSFVSLANRVVGL